MKLKTYLASALIALNCFIVPNACAGNNYVKIIDNKDNKISLTNKFAIGFGILNVMAALVAIKYSFSKYSINRKNNIDRYYIELKELKEIDNINHEALNSLDKAKNLIKEDAYDKNYEAELIIRDVETIIHKNRIKMNELSRIIKNNQ